MVLFITAALASFTTEVMAQIFDSTASAGANATTKVSTILSLFFCLVKVAGYSLFMIVIVIAGYKIAFVEGYKTSHAKGIVIGGFVFGLTATLESYLTA